MFSYSRLNILVLTELWIIKDLKWELRYPKLPSSLEHYNILLLSNLSNKNVCSVPGDKLKSKSKWKKRVNNFQIRWSWCAYVGILQFILLISPSQFLMICYYNSSCLWLSGGVRQHFLKIRRSYRRLYPS